MDKGPVLVAAIVAIAVTVGIMDSGPSTGGGINPARAWCPAIVSGDGDHRGVWVYIIGPLLGGLLAGLLDLFLLDGFE